jgi:hypothetical protein
MNGPFSWASRGIPDPVKIAFAEIVDHAEKTGDGMQAYRYTRHGTQCSSARASS